MVHVEFDSKSENEGIARVVVATYLMKFNPTVEEMADVKTAVSEAVTNSIVHGYDHEKGIISLHIDSTENVVTVTVEDHGKGIDNVKQAMEPLFTTKPEDERTGMGFSFMEAFMDQVEVSSEWGKGTKIVMTKEMIDRQ